MARRCWRRMAAGRAVGALTPEWHGFNVLHTAAARVGALDLGFVPGAERQVAGADAGWRRRCAVAAGCRRVRHGAHRRPDVRHLSGPSRRRRRGAGRRDPAGAAYTEKSGTYVNTEGRVQRGFLAVYPPGEAREDWKILRAFSELSATRCLMTRSTRCARRLEQVNPVFGRIGFLPRFGCIRPGRSGRRSGGAVRYAIRAGDRQLLSDRSDQPRQSHHGRMHRDLRAPRRWSRRRSSAMQSFFFDTDIGLRDPDLRRGAGAAGAAADRRRLSDLRRAQGAGGDADAQRARTWSAHSACCSRSPTRSRCS